MTPYLILVFPTFEDADAANFEVAKVVHSFDPEARTLTTEPYDNSSDYDGLSCTGTPLTAKAHIESIIDIVGDKLGLTVCMLFLPLTPERDLDFCGDGDDCEDDDCEYDHEGDDEEDEEIEAVLMSHEEFLDEYGFAEPKDEDGEEESDDEDEDGEVTEDQGI